VDISIQTAGWIGTLLIVLAYFLVSFKKTNPGSKSYQLMNLFGAIGIGINVFYHQAWPAFAMEVIWALIAVFALVNILKRR
jgi:hypothetical protein